jgi:small subunit ribosomal protein S4
MGDPKKIQKKYSKPSHPWQKIRIDEENSLVKEYGLKNKKEIWKAKTELKKYADQAKFLVSSTGERSKFLQEQMISRLTSLGFIPMNGQLDDVLSLGITNILEKRLQTLVFRKGISKSLIQARQMITHGHIAVNGKKMTVPGYIVKRSEEDFISFLETSPFADSEHPEMVKTKKKDESSLAEVPEQK